ncbi:Hypothetical protein PHPALM_3160 [Phytophthora palmivora]|uniref:M96 mating-specific protein family n=1 Tax=Phytophthora palmivora TaxID=4796 RepID=A0A2P4YN39_9STRA|nr:Hypothetical protein PHPALM_3160 [Phytophthora palmivora]
MTDVIDEAFINEMVTLLDSGALELSGIEGLTEAPTYQLCAGGSRSDTETSSNDTKHPKRRIMLREKETKRRRVYRQRLKDDRNALQHEVDGLTLTLETMKQTVLHRKVTNDRTFEKNGDDNGNVDVDMWKAMATWELEALKHAQGEQKQLLSTIASKSKIIKDLRSVVLSRFSKHATSPIQELAAAVTEKPSDDSLYEAYLHEVDVNYSRIDDEFRACGFHSKPKGITNSVVMNSDGSTKEFLHVNKALQPFRFLSFCDVIWRLSGRDHRQQDRELYDNFKDPDNNTIAVKFRVSKVLSTGAMVSMQQRLVVRRYVEANHFVLVWKLFVEGEGFYHGMHSNESGWCRLRPSTSQDGTWMEMYVRRSPMHYRVALSRGEAVRLFDDVLDDLIKEDHEEFMRAEEKRENRNTEAAKRRKRHCHKVKEEKKVLAQQASELVVQLSRLQRAKTEMKARQLQNFTLGAWKAVSLRQLERRLQVEKQQKLLKDEVALKSRMIHQMNRLLRENLQSQQENIISFESMNPSLETEGLSLFKTMSSEMDDLYLQTDKVMRGLTLKSSSVPLQYNLTRKWDQGVLYFDSADKIKFPYDFKETWYTISAVLVSGSVTDLVTTMERKNKNIVNMNYRTKYKSRQGGTAECLIYSVARRYVEKDRLVHVWRRFIEGKGEFHGYHAEETAWLIVRPSNETFDTVSDTILESYSRLVPMVFGNLPGCDMDIDRFVQIIAESRKNETKLMVEMMEKLITNDQ